MNDKVGDVQATCVKKEDIKGISILIFIKKLPFLFDWLFKSIFIKLYSIEVCKRNGESCGHHRGIIVDNGGMVPSKFDGHCCEGSVCRYPTLGVVGKCIDEGIPKNFVLTYCIIVRFYQIIW